MSDPSPGLAIAWRIAASEAGAAGYTKIECAHLMMGLLSLDKATPKALKDLGFDPALMTRVAAEEAAIGKLFEPLSLSTRVLRRDLRSRVKKRPVRAKGVMSRSVASKAAFAQAEKLAGAGPINALHLLAVLLREPDPPIAALVADRRLGADLVAKAATASARTFNTGIIKRASPTTRLAKPRLPAPATPSEAPAPRYSRDLSAMAQGGELGPVIGRRKEILGVVQSLTRPARLIALMVGEEGVGKAVIAEAVAIRALEGKDPGLSGKRILELNVEPLLAADSQKRTKELLDELRASPDIILFIPGIHLLMGAHPLKQALARGEVPVIGSTTPRDFRDVFEKDAALERRFEKIDVGEPSITEALDILKGLKERLERRHDVRIADEALEAAVQLSVRFDTDQLLPGKAVDLIKRAATRSRVPALADETLSSSRAPKATAGAAVDARGVAEALAEKRGLPIEIVTDGAGEGARLLKLEAQLKSKVVGQDEAVAAVAARIKAAHAGASTRSGPLAVFLFIGPTGVGKTETARSLARFLFNGPEDLIRFDMGEYAEEASVPRLVGDGGLLAAAIRSKPRSVILLDEVEKAHAKVFDALASLFETGRIADSKGGAAEAHQAVVVMTSSVASGQGPAKKGPAINETVPFTKEGQQKAELRRFFRPELLNRIDDVISFRPLDEADVRRIARPVLAALITKVRKTHGVLVRFESEAEVFVLRQGFDAEKGIRELKSVIERLVDIPLAKLAVSGKLAQHPAWKAVHEGGGLYFLPE